MGDQSEDEKDAQCWKDMCSVAWAEARAAETALAASAARIEALTEALQRIADRFQKNGEDLHGFINATRDIARAAIDAAPRSDDRKSDEFWSFTNGIGR